MNTNPSSGFFEKLEANIVFKYSRLILLIIALLAIIIVGFSAFFAIYGVIPASKPSVEMAAFPDSAKVSKREVDSLLADTGKVFKASSAKQVREWVDREKDTVKKSIEIKAVVFNSLIDSLKNKVVPDSLYAWESKGYYSTDSWGYRDRWVVTYQGVAKRIEPLYKDNYTYDQAILNLQQLISFLHQYPMASRLNAINPYVQLFLKKEYERNIEIEKIKAEHDESLVKAEKDYEETVARKDDFFKKSLMTALAAIGVVISIALTLILFAIQRDLRKIADRKNGEL